MQSVRMPSLLLFFTMVVSNMVHGLCDSEQKGANVIYDCSSEVVASIPTYIPNYTTHLNLSSNPIQTLSYAMLSRFFNLKVLDLSFTYLSHESFPADVLSRIDTMEEFYIRDCRLRKLRSPTLRDTGLKVLRLDKNKISHIPAEFLDNLPNLEDLSLSECDIESISPDAFKLIGGSLKHIDLSHNRLETLSLDTRPHLFTSKLRTIRLHDNFWNCDCHLKWLREEIDVTTAAWYFDGYNIVPECEEPKSLKHVNWFKAKDDRFGCLPELLSKQSDLQVALGGNLTLNCTVRSYIEPELVVWESTNYKSIEFSSRLRSTQRFDGSVLTSILYLSSVADQDYGQYNCTVATKFGTVIQTTDVAQPPLSATADKSTTTIAVAVVVSVVVIIIAVIAAIFIKKHLVYRGKLYMDGISEMSQKSDVDISMQATADDSTCMTPLNVTVNSSTDTPDIIKDYTEDELDSLPVESEYPADDAGCAEYNKYLEAVSSANHSPAYSSDSSNTNTKQPNIIGSRSSPANYTDTAYRKLPSSPTAAVYDNPASLVTHKPAYISTNRQSPYTDTPTANQISGYNRVSPLVPYSVGDTPTSQHSPNDNIISRLNTTPSGSPLTFIKEEPEDTSTTELL